MIAAVSTRARASVDSIPSWPRLKSFLAGGVGSGNAGSAMTGDLAGRSGFIRGEHPGLPGGVLGEGELLAEGSPLLGEPVAPAIVPHVLEAAQEVALPPRQRGRPALVGDLRQEQPGIDGERLGTDPHQVRADLEPVTQHRLQLRKRLPQAVFGTTFLTARPEPPGQVDSVHAMRGVRQVGQHRQHLAPARQDRRRIVHQRDGTECGEFQGHGRKWIQANGLTTDPKIHPNCTFR